MPGYRQQTAMPGVTFQPARPTALLAKGFVMCTA
jgi:hypothetical protein